MDNRFFSEYEAVALTGSLFCTKWFLTAPTLFYEVGGHSAFFTLLFVHVLAAVCWRFSCDVFTGKDLSDVCDAVGGAKLRQAVGTAASVVLLLLAALTLRQYVQNAKLLTLHTFPTLSVTALFGFAMLLGARCGEKSVAKAHSFFVPAVFLTLLLLILLASPNFRFSNLFPLLGKGIGALFGHGFFLLSSLTEGIALFYLPPLIKEPRRIKRVGNLILLFSFVCGTLVLTCYIFAAPGSSDSVYLPIFQIVRLIQVGDIFQRADSLFLMIFALSGLLYLSAVLLLLCRVFARTFRLPYKQPLTVPFGLLIISLSVITFIADSDAILTVLYRFLWILPFPTALILRQFALRKERKK